MTTSKKATKSSPTRTKGADAAETATAVEAEDGGVEASDTGAAGPTPPALLSEPNAAQLLAAQGEQMLDARNTVANAAAKIVGDVLVLRPEMVVPLVDKFAKGIASKHKKVVQVAADALPQIAKVAPARVARHLELLKSSFAECSEEGQDGLVRTFAALCIASVAYQKRLEPVLTEALAGAEGKTLLRWTQTVLPALKGEPHARARAVVEARLDALPKPVAQPIADFLGIKLRPRQR